MSVLVTRAEVIAHVLVPVPTTCTVALAPALSMLPISLAKPTPVKPSKSAVDPRMTRFKRLKDVEWA
jgi:hypothetical protein